MSIKQIVSPKSIDEAVAPTNGHVIEAWFDGEKDCSWFFEVEGGTIAAAAQSASEQLFSRRPTAIKVRTVVRTSQREEIAKLLVKQERRLVVCGMRGGDL